MKLYKEISLADFEAWGGAEKTLARVRDNGLCDTLEAIIVDGMGDLTEDDLNDILLDDDTVYDWLGLEKGSELKSRIEDAKEELASLKEEIKELEETISELEEEYKEYF